MPLHTTKFRGERGALPLGSAQLQTRHPKAFLGIGIPSLPCQVLSSCGITALLG